MQSGMKHCRFLKKFANKIAGVMATFFNKCSKLEVVLGNQEQHAKLIIRDYVDSNKRGLKGMQSCRRYLEGKNN